MISKRCSQCGCAEGRGGLTRVASIAGSIMGNENIDTWYRCPACGWYTMEACVDHFDGEETSRIDGPISREQAERMVAIISRCPVPHDKKCRCPAHREYFRDALD